MLDYHEIESYLIKRGYVACTQKYDGKSSLVVLHQIGTKQVKLVHFHITQFESIPIFVLDDSSDYGQLAHVLSVPEKDYACICVSDTDSLSINYEQPHLAIEASLEKHIGILTKAIEDPDWNNKELLREFQANWSAICANDQDGLVLAAEEGSSETITIYNPLSSSRYGLDSRFLGVTESSKKLNKYAYINSTQLLSERKKSGAIGYVLSVPFLPLPPTSRDNIKEWFLELTNTLDDKAAQDLKEQAGSYRSSKFWLVINGPTPSGTAWFGISLKNSVKKALPLTSEKLESWTLEPCNVLLFNPALLMPRSGANLHLTDKRVLLVGCGSVGSEIADKIASAGVGELYLLDYDVFEFENIYRNSLHISFVGINKAQALKYQVGTKYPWLNIECIVGELLDKNITQKTFLQSFDLIVIAIGSPTHERLFHDFLIKNQVQSAVINTWVEGYGVGGHAVLDIHGSKGCLRCAYIDNETETNGLSSNLNFLEDDQSLTVNHAGCGQLYLPYSGVNSAQTAIMATDLAVRYLRGNISESSKISWKGDSIDALQKGFELTHRYYNFDQSLKTLPLLNASCDLCRD
ncbi:ThiF family adenylyltransferase [Neptuniibacter sp. QD37_11]|uniref:ThiF family adenylyltransferase n=1 Tax=Neptuniibacter sp. QD37_11 TaxID=3398209 RepID=UPI0039F5B6C5